MDCELDGFGVATINGVHGKTERVPQVLEISRVVPPNFVHQCFPLLQLLFQIGSLTLQCFDLVVQMGVREVNFLSLLRHRGS